MLQLHLSVTDDPGAGYFASAPDRIVNFFTVFVALALDRRLRGARARPA